MRLDTANRSLLALVVVSGAVLYVSVGLSACVLLGLIAYELASDGFGEVMAAQGAVLPALVFLLPVAAGVMVGLRSLYAQTRSSLRLSRRVRHVALRLPARLVRSAADAGLAGRVEVVDSDGRFSFVYGAFDPRVTVSRGLLETVSDDELAAVLAHERYHVHNLDPLKVVLARALRAAVFYLPTLRALEYRYIAGRELAADSCAVRSCGRRSLVGALIKVARGPAWPELGTAAAIGGEQLLDVRVVQLETGRQPRLGRLSRSEIAVSLLALLALAGAFAVSVLAFGGLSAVVERTMYGARLEGLDLLLAPLCVVPWVVGAWIVYRWLSARARRELETTVG